MTKAVCLDSHFSPKTHERGSTRKGEFVASSNQTLGFSDVRTVDVVDMWPGDSGCGVVCGDERTVDVVDMSPGESGS